MTSVAIHPSAAVPHVIAAEQNVLGTLLLEPQRLHAAIKAGGEGLFYDPLHSEIFRIIADKDKHSLLVSPVSVAEALRGSDALGGVGGVGYLARLAGSSSGAMFAGYIQMLADARSKRDLVAAISDAQAAIAKGEDQAADIAARLEASLLRVSHVEGRQGPVSMMKAVAVAMGQVKDAFEGNGESYVRTGINALDQIITGMFPGEMILLGGRPSMGKTGVALAIALNAARAGDGVCIASLEMNPEAMALRALSEATAHARNAVQYSRMRRGDMSDPQVATLQQCAAHVAALPITFLPRSFSDIGALYSGAKQAARTMEGGMKLMVVDYAQLLRSQAKSRYEQITEVSIALKALAGDLGVPVLALSQLSRSIESRDDKRPVLSDLRESGQLEQDADTVMFCFRGEYYLERDKPNEHDKAEDIQAWQDLMARAKNRLEIIVAKQRQGEIGTAHVRFNPALNLIWEGY